MTYSRAPQWFEIVQDGLERMILSNRATFPSRSGIYCEKPFKREHEVSREEEPPTEKNSNVVHQQVDDLRVLWRTVPCVSWKPRLMLVVQQYAYSKSYFPSEPTCYVPQNLLDITYVNLARRGNNWPCWELPKVLGLYLSRTQPPVSSPPICSFFKLFLWHGQGYIKYKIAKNARKTAKMHRCTRQCTAASGYAFMHPLVARHFQIIVKDSIIDNISQKA